MQPTPKTGLAAPVQPVTKPLAQPTVQFNLQECAGKYPALDCFLAMYGKNPNLSRAQMREHLLASGFRGWWPLWAVYDCPMTEQDARDWGLYICEIASAASHPLYTPETLQAQSAGHAMSVKTDAHSLAQRQRSDRAGREGPAA